MAQPKLIAVVLLALFAVALAAESRETLKAISKQSKKGMNDELSEEDQADAEEAFSMAKEHTSKLEGSEKQFADEMLTAWDQILHNSSSCNELSLRYIDLIYNRGLKKLTSLKMALIEPIKKYARKCMTSDNIANMIKLRAGRISEINLDFVDDQFIADYWSTNPLDKLVIYVEPAALSEAIIKAIKRGREKKIKVPRTKAQVRAYLNERLYKPCIEYKKALKDVMVQIFHANYALDWSRGNLYETLDKEVQRVFFRYELCRNIYLLTGRAEMEAKVSSNFTRLAALSRAVSAWTRRTSDS